MRSKVWAALPMALILTLAACGDANADAGGDGLELVTPGTLTVCTDAPYPPMEYEENGEYTGFDIELMRAIAADNGLELAVNNIGFDPITSGIAMESGECDIAAASITITEEREANIDFSVAYFTADQSLLVKKDSGFATLADLAGQRLGVQTGTTGEIYAGENAPDDTEIVSFENPGDLFTALAAGDIAGILQDIIPNAAAAAEDASIAIIETYPTAEEYGFAVKEEGAENVLAAVNSSIEKLRGDGTYQEIYDRFFPGG
jgi:polar amino acid transport system substrate-binding protein